MNFEHAGYETRIVLLCANPFGKDIFVTITARYIERHYNSTKVSFIYHAFRDTQVGRMDISSVQLLHSERLEKAMLANGSKPRLTSKVGLANRCGDVRTYCIL